MDDAGASYVVYGEIGESDNIYLANLTPAQGYTIMGAQAGANTGFSVSSGDINKDGKSDVIIGAPSTDVSGEVDEGVTYIVYGVSNPTTAPTVTPSFKPSSTPSQSPTATITSVPSVIPTIAPSEQPTMRPSTTPTTMPTTCYPTINPTSPTFTPTLVPSAEPTSKHPTTTPTVIQTKAPTKEPTFIPTILPTASPTLYITIEITSGGIYTGSEANEHFVVNAAASTLITGGGGNDDYIMIPHSNVKTTITDFNPVLDIIDLTSFSTVHNINDLDITYTTATIINLPGNEQILLSNLAVVTSTNFILSPPSKSNTEL